MRATPRLRRAIVATAAIAVTPGCCPIPWLRTVSVRPELTVEVTDAHGAPVAGAEVVVRRFVAAPGPEDALNRWTATTGPDGRITLPAIEETETVLPLMMHGVPWYGWEACVQAPGPPVCERVQATRPVEAPHTLTLALGGAP